MTENQSQKTAKPKLIVTPSPHVKDSISTQKVMLTVAVALLPSLIASVYYFGLRSLVLTAMCVISCMLFEQLFTMITHRESTIGDCSAVVTGMILAFNVPVTLPLWMAAFGSFIAIIVVKCLFGGIGCNFANPAATARIFLLVSFATPMTTWVAPLRGSVPPAGDVIGSFAGVDYIASATPLSSMAEMGIAGATPASGGLPSLLQMFLGARGGSLGETCALALIIGGIFLIWKGIISPLIPVSVIASVFVFALVFGADPFYAVLSGGVMIGAFFMATDYSTSPLTNKGKLVFGIGIGFITMVIRSFCSYPEGMSFAILLMNILTPHIDRLTVPKPFGAVFEQKKDK
ncbi:RnfABCDGE type electron transport complex subunit D [Oscillospiraceae bacterium PP1C4]